jgi:hypothetical protein
MIDLRVGGFALVLLSLLAMGLSASQAQSPAPIKAGTLTATTFKALPDDAMFELKDGSRKTARAIRQESEQRLVQARAKLAAAAEQTRAKLAAARAQLLDKQKAETRTNNAKVLAEVEHRRQAEPRPSQSEPSEADIQEALQLVVRSRTASPAERQALDARASELLPKTHR